ncbi:protein-disulfide reductase DsbD domain-containing protein [Aquicoccus porphyridii]|uniref:protein-disulfide reductase DsbD domain-containing protein n=1 Tax=Aquicoccus porphyridii TaxID=1852029 RepID=UPI00273D8FD6|nr:protein-disulfide reductase DsbD domain-containing protein [Aquicoccus porphyridii]
MIKLTALLCALVLAALPLRANPYADMVAMRLIPGWQMPDGTLMAGLDIRLAPGWKTYWRAPGDAGIPPVFDWAGSRNLASVGIRWPRPEVFDQNGMRSIGYQGHVILPLSITPARAGQPVQLTGRIDIGICQDVCIPVQLDLDRTTLAARADTRPVPSIVAALADQPVPGEKAGLARHDCAIAPSEDGLILTARFALPPTGRSETAALETADPMIWVSEPRMERAGGTLTATFELMNVTGQPFALDRSGLRFTILGESRAVDIHGCGG